MQAGMAKEVVMVQSDAKGGGVLIISRAAVRRGGCGQSSQNLRVALQ